MSQQKPHNITKKVIGDDIVANDFNMLIDLAAYHPSCDDSELTKPWYNAAATACPAYGVAAVTGTNGTEPDKILEGDRPADPAAKQYIVNTEEECDATSEGTYQNGEWVLVFYDDAVDTPAFEEVWGPEPDEWYLTKGAASTGWGIVVAGIVDSDAKILLGKIVGDGGDGIFYGEVQSGFTNADGTANRTVSVKACDIDGTAVGDQTAFDTKTPLKSNAFTDLVTGDVVGYMIDSAGEKVIVTDCWTTGGKAGKPWVSLDVQKKLIHLHPQSSDISDEGDVTVEHYVTSPCGFYIDDCGHVLGYYACGVWVGPWPEPVFDVTVEQAAGQVDPTNASPVHFTVIFDRKTTDFVTGDATIGGTATGIGQTITPVGDTGRIYDLAVTATGSGTIIATVEAGKATDGGIPGKTNRASTSVDNEVVFDITPPVPTVAYSGTTPSGAATITFDVSFDEPVTGFSVAAVGGTAGATTAVVTAVSSTAYTVAVTGMTTDGTVTLHVDANVAQDVATNWNTVSNTATMDWFIKVADRTIAAGAYSPDVSGTYVNTGSWEGKALYFNGTYYICWYPTTDWVIVTQHPSLGLVVRFNRTNANVAGAYGPQSGASGNPVVT